MDVLEKFLHSISYKFPKGYPDMKNDQDILILERELFKHNIDFELAHYKLLSIVMLHAERMNGRRYSVVLFAYWLLSTLVSLAVLRSLLLIEVYENDNIRSLN